MIRSALKRLRDFLAAPVLSRLEARELRDGHVVGQKALSALYRQLFHSRAPRPTFGDVGFRVHSQHEEDGILLYLFALLGTADRRCVEISAGDGIECNTANLIVNHRFTGLLVDADEGNVERAERFYSTHPDTRFWPNIFRWISTALLPFKNPITNAMLYLGGTLRHMWMWSGIKCPSTNSTPRCRHKSRSISPTRARNLP